MSASTLTATRTAMIKRFWTAEEAAKSIGMHRKTFVGWADKLHLKPIKFDRGFRHRHFWQQSDIDSVQVARGK